MNTKTALLGKGTRNDPFVPEIVIDLKLVDWTYGNGELTSITDVEVSRIKGSQKWRSAIVSSKP